MPVVLGLLIAFALTAPSGIAAESGPQRLPAPAVPEFDRQTPARDDVPAHVAVVDGAASLEREGRREALEENTLLLAGDRIRTERGRVEVLFDDGSVLDVDEFTSMDLMSDSLMRLTAGRIRLAIPRVTNTLTYRIDAAGTTSWIENAGEYRVAIRDSRATTPEVELSVFRGQAELETPHGTTRVRTGAQAFAVSTSAPSQSYAVNVAIVDDFDRWTENLRTTRLGDDSARYLPPELSYYGGELDESGSWGHEADYGAVWYPRVDVGWRPYYNGRWSFYGSFGWTWIGGPRWTYPTHHYGRWGYSNRWYWIPGRRWAPAYVSWGYYPGYVSWCPLGYTGYPVVPIQHVNYFAVDPWVAWTVVPSRTFVHGFRPAPYVVAQPTIAKPVWSQFATRNAGPTGPVTGTSRTPPLRSPTYAGQAVLRDSPPTSGVATGSRVAPQWQAARDPDGTTRVRPQGEAPSRTAPSAAAAAAPDTAFGNQPSASRAPSARQPARTGSAVIREAPPDTSPEVSNDTQVGSRTRSSVPMTTAPYTRSSAVERNRPATQPAPPDDPGVQGSREIMPGPSRTLSRPSGFYRDDRAAGPPPGSVYRSPSGEPRAQPETRGTAVPRSGPPAAAAPGGESRGPAPEAPRPAPSRVQPRSAPPAQAPPPPPQTQPAPSSGGRSAPPASSGTQTQGQGRAVRRGGGR